MSFYVNLIKKCLKKIGKTTPLSWSLCCASPSDNGRSRNKARSCGQPTPLVITHRLLTAALTYPPHACQAEQHTCVLWACYGKLLAISCIQIHTQAVSYLLLEPVAAGKSCWIVPNTWESSAVRSDTSLQRAAEKEKQQRYRRLFKLSS